MTTTISVADLKRPVTVELRQDDPNEWFVYLFDRAGDEIANFGISTPASLAIAEQTRDAINRYPGLVAALHRLLDFSDHKSWCWYIQADELARAQTRCNCWFRGAQDAAQSALTGSGHVFMSEDEAEFIASRVNHHAALVAAVETALRKHRAEMELLTSNDVYMPELVTNKLRAYEEQLDAALTDTPPAAPPAETPDHLRSLLSACEYALSTAQTLLEHPEPVVILEDRLNELSDVLKDVTTEVRAALLIETALVLDGSVVPPGDSRVDQLLVGLARIVRDIPDDGNLATMAMRHNLIALYTAAGGDVATLAGDNT